MLEHPENETWADWHPGEVPQEMPFAGGLGSPAENISAREDRHGTPETLRNGVEKIVTFLCKDFSVEGKDNVEEIRRIQEEDANNKFIVTSSHISNLDAPAAIKALGNDLDFQLAVSSTHFGLTPQELMYRMAGKENFTGLDYRKNKRGSADGAFNPDNFDELAEKMEAGKTPWIAIHPFTASGKMQKARIGPVYLAQKTGSYLVPSALEIKNGGSVSFEGLSELTKAAVKKAEAVFHVGQPIKLEPIDIRIIEEVLQKRQRGEKPTTEELKRFSETTTLLKKQADDVAEIISRMLPERMRGAYGEEAALN
ncbi:MAG: hypothetical protein ACHP78_00385 [Terriglobales bacterium]